MIKKIIRKKKTKPKTIQAIKFNKNNMKNRIINIVVLKGKIQVG
jgi:hypothetical protein